MKIIGLLSDFGLRDSYVAEMKAAILSRCPEARLLDISHEIRKFDVRMGAFVLASAARSFPKDSIFLAVVDPGVGSERMSLVVESDRSLYVGPDNGLLMLAALRERVRCVYRIDNVRYLATVASATFHGRDIFARVVGDLATGIPPSEIGPRTPDYVKPEFHKPVVEKEFINGEVLHVDDFGNVVTNIDESNIRAIGLGDRMILRAGRRRMRLQLVRTYDEIPEGCVGCLFGSHGFLEIAMKMKRASRFMHVRAGSKLAIKF